jgi:serine/threonine protein kinase
MPLADNDKVIQREVAAIELLSACGGHDHVIRVLRHGGLPETHEYFIDMEWCDMSLANYLYQSCPLKVQSVLPALESLPISLRPLHNWNISRQIVEGLTYMHRCGVVHRDLKPMNRKPPDFVPLTHSSVFDEGNEMEAH